MSNEHVVIPEEFRERLSSHFNARLGLFMIGYEILTEGRLYSWHLEMDVDSMDQAQSLWDHLEAGNPVNDWLVANKVA